MEGTWAMKKWGLALICALLLMGCHHNQSIMNQEIDLSTKQYIYQYQDLLLYINQGKDGFSFQIELNEVGIGDYAIFTDRSHQQATCVLSSQKDCQLTFTFEEDYVIVKTTKEDEFLGVDLSGHYVLQEALS